MTVKVVPTPGWLRTLIPPPISSTRRLLIASPSPVPPWRRVLEVSSCENALNSRVIPAAEMPIPESTTSMRSDRGGKALTRTTTSPASVNLTALLIRLSST